MKMKNGDKAASFFKIIRDDSVDYLPLPNVFAKKYMEKVNNIKKISLVLQPKSDVKWSVKYLKIKDNYYFFDGWLNFMKENHLRNHDFLVFWLLSAAASPNKLTFLVMLYAPNGSLKQPISTSSSSPNFPSTFPTTGRRRQLFVEKKVTAEPEVKGDGKKRSVKEESNDDDSLQKVHKHKSTTKVLRKGYLRQLPISKKFWRATGLNRYNIVHLRNDMRKIWKVRVSKYGKIKVPNLTTGWSDFWKANDMKMSNTFQITHVKGNLLHVHVIKRQ